MFVPKLRQKFVSYAVIIHVCCCSSCSDIYKSQTRVVYVPAQKETQLQTPAPFSRYFLACQANHCKYCPHYSYKSIVTGLVTSNEMKDLSRKHCICVPVLNYRPKQGLKWAIVKGLTSFQVLITDTSKTELCVPHSCWWSRYVLSSSLQELETLAITNDFRNLSR